MIPYVDLPSIAIDVGQTGLRLGIAQKGRPLVRAPEVMGPGYLDGHPFDSVLRSVRAAAASLTHRPEVVGTICVGLTTVVGRDTEYVRLAAYLRDEFNARQVVVTGDGVTAHAGALGGRAGVVLAAGTGAVAVGLTEDGVGRQVDGWGYLYGDAGSGWWIGRRGLEAAVRGHDGRSAAGPLTARATEMFGHLGSLPERLYGAPDAVRRIAAFARLVLQSAAEGQGDAAAIVAEAGGELAKTAAAAGADFEADQGFVVSWTGRLLDNACLRESFLAALSRIQPKAKPAEPIADGLAGSAHIAADPTRYARLLKAAVQ